MKKYERIEWVLVFVLVAAALAFIVANCDKYQRMFQYYRWEWFSNDSVLILKK